MKGKLVGLKRGTKTLTKVNAFLKDNMLYLLAEDCTQVERRLNAKCI